MRLRETPRDVKAAYPYFVVDLGAAGTIVMRRPRAAGMALAHAAIAQSRDQGIAEQLQSAALARRLEIAQSLQSLMAALVGLCWSDVSHDLEAVPPPAPLPLALEAYGEDVTDELTEHGLSPGDIALLWARCMGEIGRTETELAGALSALGFTGRRAGDSSPSSASPGSSGTATPTPSGA
jgi:hypothetical protein